MAEAELPRPLDRLAAGRGAELWLPAVGEIGQLSAAATSTPGSLVDGSDRIAHGSRHC